MKVDDHPIFYGLLLAAILRTVIATGEALAHEELRLQPRSRFEFTSQFVKDILKAKEDCTRPSAVTTGEDCDILKAFTKIQSDIEQRIFSTGTSENDYNAMAEEVQLVLYMENSKTEDFLDFETKMCFHESKCEGGKCGCDSTKPDYTECMNHRPKVVSCTKEVATYRQMELAESRVWQLYNLTCFTSSRAGKGEPCKTAEETIRELAKEYGLSPEDQMAVFARMSAQDWDKRLIQWTCAYGTCGSSRKCECRPENTKCNAHKQEDMDAFCSAEIQKIVNAFDALAKLTGLVGPPGTAGGENEGAKSEHPKQAHSMALVNIPISATILLGLLMVSRLIRFMIGQ